MKKVAFALSLCGLFVFSSCGGDLATQVADSICKCAKLEGEEATKCNKESQDKFKEQVEKMEDAKKMEFLAKVMSAVAKKCPDAGPKM